MACLLPQFFEGSCRGPVPISQVLGWVARGSWPALSITCTSSSQASSFTESQHACCQEMLFGCACSEVCPTSTAHAHARTHARTSLMMVYNMCAKQRQPPVFAACIQAETSHSVLFMQERSATHGAQQKQTEHCSPLLKPASDHIPWTWCKLCLHSKMYSTPTNCDCTVRCTVHQQKLSTMQQVMQQYLALLPSSSCLLMVQQE